MTATEKEFNKLIYNIVYTDKAEDAEEQFSLYLDKHFSLEGLSEAELKKLNGPNAEKLHNKEWKNYCQELWLRRFIDSEGRRIQPNRKKQTK